MQEQPTAHIQGKEELTASEESPGAGTSMGENILIPKFLQALPGQPTDPTFPVNVEEIQVPEVAWDQLLQLAKLASVGNLVSEIAHAINNPLAIIMGYSELLQGRR